MKVAIVIPLYSSSLSKNDIISLKRCNNLFSDYDKIVVTHKNLDLSNYEEYLSFKRIEIFETKYFLNVRAYSNLMLNKDFYYRFLDYTYILIYQTDAYVFRNELDLWCSHDYTYVGAPWVNLRWFDEKFPKLSKLTFIKHFIRKVGNGGLSLRKVRSFYYFTKKYNWILKNIYFQEDIVLSNLCPLLSTFKTPSVDEATKFSFDETPEELYVLNNHSLPFGCHGWNTKNEKFWSKFIPR